MSNTLKEILDYWFWDAKEECFRDTRTNQIVSYANKEKQKELIEKNSNVSTTN